MELLVKLLMELLVKLLMELLMELLAIRLTKQKTLGKSLVIAIRLGCQNTTTKSLVISPPFAKGEAKRPARRGGWTLWERGRPRPHAGETPAVPCAVA